MLVYPQLACMPQLACNGLDALCGPACCLLCLQDVQAVMRKTAEGAGGGPAALCTTTCASPSAA